MYMTDLSRSTAFILLTIFASATAVVPQRVTSSFTVEQIKSYPFPNELTAAATGSRIAWAFHERGLRNIWVAEGPDFQRRRLTNYNIDDGQELTSVSISADGKYVVYVRGGDHGSNFDLSVGVNPTLGPVAVKVQIFSIPFAGGEPKLLADGDEPLVSPKGDRVVFVKERGLWVVPIDGSAPGRRMFFARGDSDSPEWSPDGSQLAFVSNRGDHSFIGIYRNDATPIVYLAPSTSRDLSPRWSPDGKRIAFVRRPGTGGVPEPVLEQRPLAWAIWTGDADAGEARQLWKSPFTLRGSPPNTHGGTNLHWAAAGRIVFLSYLDGWPHLYSIADNGPANPSEDSRPLLLTPGNYMCEYISLSPDRRHLVFAANAGTDPDDIDRRHIVRVSVDKADPVVMTTGKGLEWTPFVIGDSKHIAFIGATAQRPPLPMVMPTDNAGATSRAPVRVLAEDRIPSDFPAAQLVVPKKVVFKAPDGVEVHGQLFEPPRTSSGQLRSGGAEEVAGAEMKSVPPRGSGWVLGSETLSPLRSESNCRESRFAASPPDVRKGYALPGSRDEFRGSAPKHGRSPALSGVTSFGRAEPPPHIGRHSRDVEFSHVLAQTPITSTLPQIKRPAIVFVHGGPPRQMLLGWHYSDYYSNAYAMNQYLASRGFIVLSVNYRLGIGYGHDFHRPPKAGAQGASEYQDVKAAGEYLKTLPQVDPTRIGIYGGSYGGFLTALALARDSKLFSAGVDIHGVHNWTAERAQSLLENRYEKPPDTQAALDVAWQSSPVSSITTWKSSVLLIHGDDDRNVRFSQTTDLVRRLEKAGVPFEELVIPDDTHHFLRHANSVKVDAAVAAFFERVFGRK
jgi:dipeptidyl aminopeptidase/acylaminoacyl peptidase